MTKFGEEITLDSINVKSFYRLPVTKGEDNCFLVNDGRNSVVKVLDKKLIHSWTLTHPNSFTCPVTFCSTDESVYGIVNSETLLIWSATDETLKNATKFKFKEPVFAILPVIKQKPIILFASGKVLQAETLSSSTVPLGEDFIQKGDLIWADAVAQDLGITVICISISRKKNIYKLHCFTICKTGITDYFNQTLTHESDILKCWCLNKSTSVLFTMWSSGVILNHQLGVTRESKLLSVTDVQDLHLLAIESISPSEIAVMKCNPNKKETFLEIWDIKFCALKAKKNLKTVFSNSISMLAVDSKLFFSHNEGLMEISFQAGKSTLASAVGISTTTVTQINEFSWKKGKLLQVTHTDQHTSEQMDTSEVEQKTLNPTELIAQKIMKEDSVYLKYIPESELVKLLCLAIGCNVKNKRKCLDIKPDVILTSIFSASFNDVILVKHLKRLNLEETMVTLETLLSLLNNEMPVTSTAKTKPSDLQLFNWLCLIIQSHMEALLLSKDKKCIKLLRKLDKCLSQKMQEYEDYENVQNMFHLIQKKNNILPESYVDAKYCIETLDT